MCGVAGGDYPVHFSYHWYDNEDNVAVWNGLRTLLSTDVAPGGDIQLLAQVQAPLQPGNHVLKWDMVQEGGGNAYWFSEGYGGWPFQFVMVSVTQSPGMVFVPAVLRIRD